MSQLIDQGGFGCIFYPGFNCKGKAIDKAKKLLLNFRLIIILLIMKFL